MSLIHNKRQKYTILELLEKFNVVHQKKYKYNIQEYKNIFQKIEIICPNHGSFHQTVSNHLKGKGCRKCANEAKIGKNLKPIDTLFEEFQKVHKGRYDYSKVEYKRGDIKIEIICPVHGSFFQFPYIHKQGNGCPKCGIEKSIKSNTLTNKTVIEQFKKVHGNKYDYSMIQYEKNNMRIEIICPEHGSFFQTPLNHKNGRGCRKCAALSISEKLTLPRDKIISQFRIIHNNKYNYSKMDYIKTMGKVEIICPDHGSFFQKPNDHKNGQGCPRCKFNKNEEFLMDFFKEYRVNINHRDKNLISPLEIDILIPDFKFGIEHNGLLWHSYGISNWSATNNYDKLNKNRHLEKTISMEEQGYQLFHIREDHLLCQKKKEIWKSVLLNKCGFSHKVHARKLQAINLNDHQDFVKQFLEDNHLQGTCVSGIKLGLQDPKTGIVYSVMTFGKSRFNKNIEYELLRFCNLRYHNVRGAASKLMAHFERVYKPDSIVSYANRDWSQGNLYKAIGFEYSHTTEPNYFYVDSNFNIIKRQQAQKHKLKSFLEIRNGIFIENLSERDNMINNGYRIYYDTGNLVYYKKY